MQSSTARVQLITSEPHDQTPSLWRWALVHEPTGGLLDGSVRGAADLETAIRAHLPRSHVERMGLIRNAHGNWIPDSSEYSTLLLRQWMEQQGKGETGSDSLRKSLFQTIANHDIVRPVLEQEGGRGTTLPCGTNCPKLQLRDKAKCDDVSLMQRHAYYLSPFYQQLYAQAKERQVWADEKEAEEYAPTRLAEPFVQCEPWLSDSMLGRSNLERFIAEASIVVKEPYAAERLQKLLVLGSPAAGSTGVSLSSTGFGIGQDTLGRDAMQSLIQTAGFLDGLNRSETELLHWKRQRYMDKLQPSIDALDEWTKKIDEAKSGKLLSESGLATYEKEKDREVFKKMALTNILRLIDARLHYLASTDKEILRQERAKKLAYVVDRIESMKGEQRRPFRQALYDRIVIFAMSPSLFTNSYINNFLLMGGAGVGKSTAASIIADTLHRIGALATNKVNVRKESDLIGQYLGQTAPRTRHELEQSLEAVLFIDEAYSITGCPDKGTGEWTKTYGHEAMNTLVDFASEHTGLLSIVVAGYPKQMIECFLPINEGLPRRFGTKVMLPNYSGADLYTILEDQITRRDNKTAAPLAALTRMLGEEAATLLKSNIDTLYRDPTTAWLFAYQAGDMQNLADFILEEYWLQVARTSSDKGNGRVDGKKIVTRAMERYIEDKEMMREALPRPTLSPPASPSPSSEAMVGSSDTLL